MQGDTRDAVALDPWVGKIPWRRKSQPTPVFLPRECYGWRSLEGFSSRGCKESDMTKRLSTHAQQTVYLWSACFTVHNYASLLKTEKKKDWDTKNWLEAPYLRGGAPFCWGCPKMSVSGVFLFVCLFWSRQFSGLESSSISDLGGQKLWCYHPRNQAGEEGWATVSFHSSPYCHSASHPCLCPRDHSLGFDFSRNSYCLSPARWGKGIWTFNCSLHRLATYPAVLFPPLPLLRCLERPVPEAVNTM